jgi:hypothetical protein
MSITKETKKIYIVTGVLFVLFIILIVQITKKSQFAYDKNAKIAVKTSRGIIKMHSSNIVEELSRLRADLSKHEGYSRTNKYEIEINNTLEHIKEIIQKNKDGYTRRDIELLATINNRGDEPSKHRGILTDFDNEPDDIIDFDAIRLDHLIKNLDILISMLRFDLCHAGLIDFTMLEHIVLLLDVDLTDSLNYTNDYTADYLVDIHYDHARYIPDNNQQGVPRLALSAYSVSHATDSFDGLENQIKTSILPTVNLSSRNMQQGSQMFRINTQTLGDKHYSDDNLLAKERS